MSTHPDTADLEAFAHGQLDDAAAERVTAHLAGCTSCTAAVAVVPNDELSSRLLAAGVADIPADLLGHPRYRILARIGAGATGVVFRAVHRALGRVVAVKVVRALPGTADFLSREVAALASLSHPNIVTLLDAEVYRGLSLLVTEYVEGETLAAAIRKCGPLRPGEAMRVAAAICSALCHAHSRGVVHCDVSPRNVMLVAGGGVRVVDFGLAGLLARDADDGRAADLRGLGETLSAMLESSTVPAPVADLVARLRASVYPGAESAADDIHRARRTATRRRWARIVALALYAAPLALLATGPRVVVPPPPPLNATALPGHTNAIVALGFSRDGERLFSADSGEEVFHRIVSRPLDRPKKDYVGVAAPDARACFGYEPDARAHKVFKPTGHGVAWFIDVDRRTVTRCTATDAGLGGATSPLGTPSLFSCGRHGVASYGRRVIVWGERERGVVATVIVFDSGPVAALRSGEVLAAGAGGLSRIDMTRRRVTATVYIEGIPTCLAVDPDESRVAVGTSGRRIHLFALPNLGAKGTVGEGGSAISSLAFDRRRLLAATSAATLIEWDGKRATTRALPAVASALAVSSSGDEAAVGLVTGAVLLWRPGPPPEKSPRP